MYLDDTCFLTTYMFSYYVSWEGLEIASIYSTHILLSIPFFIESNQGSLEKGLILGLRQEIYKIKLEHLIVPGSNEVLKKKKKILCHTSPQPKHRISLEEFGAKLVEHWVLQEQQETKPSPTPKEINSNPWANGLAGGDMSPLQGM